MSTGTCQHGGGHMDGGVQTTRLILSSVNHVTSSLMTKVLEISVVEMVPVGSSQWVSYNSPTHVSRGLKTKQRSPGSAVNRSFMSPSTESTSSLFSKLIWYFLTSNAATILSSASAIFLPRHVYRPIFMLVSVFR